MAKAASDMKYIDLFAGCGGFSLGMKNAGFKGVLAIERDKMAFETFSHNLLEGKNSHFQWPDWMPKKARTVENFLSKHKDRILELRGSIDLLIGGPPCQGFSLVGQRNHSDPRNKLVNQYIKVVRSLEPKCLIMENVRGFNVVFSGTKSNLATSDKVRNSLEKLGYKVFAGYVDASDFGVPQRRVRFIIIGIHKDYVANENPFDVLKELRASFLKSKGLPIQPVSVKEAIGDLETQTKQAVLVEHARNGYLHLDYVPPSKINSYLKLMRPQKGIKPNSLRLARHRDTTVDKFKVIHRICRPGVSLNKEQKDVIGTRKQAISVLDASKPSFTLTTLPDDLLHYSEPRILTVRECARLQSFPDDFEFRGQYTTGGKKRKDECPRYTQVGNAVPPLLGEALAMYVKEIF